MTDAELIEELKQDYLDVRLLKDGSIVAIGNLLFTRAIYMDVDRYGWGRRFCFEDKALAMVEYAKLQNGDQEPVGWIARR